MKHLREFAKSVPDYRRTGKGNHRHKLEDVLLLVILGRLGKCVTRADIIRFGNRHLKRFRAPETLPGFRAAVARRAVRTHPLPYIQTYR